MAATIKCPKCGAEMNANSRVCPVCGRKRITGKDMAELFLLIILLFFGYLFIHSMRQTAKRMDKTLMEDSSCLFVSSGTLSAEYPEQEIKWIIS
ncbi:MAG: zinc ribbon domain-containing protein [Ruminococcus sp.]|nr:zinc ribbon domain-containing protein [Ruminococcus sp.]